MKRSAGRCLAIGNFEGVHRGHQWVVQHVRKIAVDHGSVPAVLTFSPHPRDRLTGQCRGIAPSRIQALHEKVFTLRRYGIEDVCIQRFTPSFSCIEPNAFVREILVERLHTRAVCVGEDFRFGRARAGDVTLLRELGLRFGFSVSVVPAYRDPCTAERISSTLLRSALSQGDVTRAASLLGRDFSMMAQLMADLDSSCEARFSIPIRLLNRFPPLTGTFDVVLIQPGGQALASGQLMLSDACRVATLEATQLLRRPCLIQKSSLVELKFVAKCAI